MARKIRISARRIDATIRRHAVTTLFDANPFKWYTHREVSAAIGRVIDSSLLRTLVREGFLIKRFDVPLGERAQQYRLRVFPK